MELSDIDLNQLVLFQQLMVEIFHSDRGSQYASKDRRDVLTEYGITASMSRRGDYWDNACSETLFGSLKVERLHGQRFKTRRQAMDEVIAWMLWYNRTRLHSTLAYVSPMQFEETGWPINPGKPVHEPSYGIRIPGQGQGTLERLWVRVSNLAATGHLTGARWSAATGGVEMWRAFNFPDCCRSTRQRHQRMAHVDHRVQSGTEKVVGCHRLRSPKTPGNRYRLESIPGVSAIGFTPLSQHSCRLWACCRAD